jgi:Zn ribbon nucleic-acid-binding protein
MPDIALDDNDGTVVGECVFCGHRGRLKPHHGGDMVCVDDVACLARGARKDGES